MWAWPVRRLWQSIALGLALYHQHTLVGTYGAPSGRNFQMNLWSKCTRLGRDLNGFALWNSNCGRLGGEGWLYLIYKSGYKTYKFRFLYLDVSTACHNLNVCQLHILIFLWNSEGKDQIPLRKICSLMDCSKYLVTSRSIPHQSAINSSPIRDQ